MFLTCNMQAINTFKWNDTWGHWLSTCTLVGVQWHTSNTRCVAKAMEEQQLHNLWKANSMHACWKDWSKGVGLALGLGWGFGDYGLYHRSTENRYTFHMEATIFRKPLHFWNLHHILTHNRFPPSTTPESRERGNATTCRSLQPLPPQLISLLHASNG